MSAITEFTNPGERTPSIGVKIKLKWLATILMLIAHIGFLLEAEPMRIIGCLSFPMGAWIFAQNWKIREPDTPAKLLITRLLLFGIIALRIFYYS